MNQLQLCTFEQAKQLKILGFDYPVNKHVTVNESGEIWRGIQTGIEEVNWNEYEDAISIPTIQHAFMFLREVKGIFIEIRKWEQGYVFGFTADRIWKTGIIESTYAEAESAALTAALEYLKNNK